MQVALVEVAEQDRPRPRRDLLDRRRQLGDQPGQGAQRYAHVQLHRYARRADRLGVRLPVRPQPGTPGHVRRDRRVPQLVALAEQLQQLVGRVGTGGALQQQVHREGLRERGAERGVRPDERDALGVADLGGGQARQPPRPGEYGQGVLGAGQPDQRHRPARKLRYQPQPYPRDDAQRALAAGEELGEVVPGVVLGQSGEPADHRTVGEDRRKSGDLVAHAAVPQHPDAAGVGGHQPADRSRRTGREVHAEVQPGCPGVRLELLQGHPGADGHLRFEHVDGFQVDQSGHADEDLVRTGHPAVDQARVAALHQDRRAGVGAGPDDGRHLGGRRRPDHTPGGTGEPAGPVRLVRRPQVGVHEDV